MKQRSTKMKMTNRGNVLQLRKCFNMKSTMQYGKVTNKVSERLQECEDIISK